MTDLTPTARQAIECPGCYGVVEVEVLTGAVTQSGCICFIEPTHDHVMIAQRHWLANGGTAAAEASHA